MLEFLIQNWFEIFIALIMLIVGVMALIKFTQKPSEEQIKAFKKFLLAAVIAAEKEMGGGTGILKLQEVYKQAIQYFPFITLIIPFTTFQKWVDEAIEEMKKLLDENERLASFVAGGSRDE